MTFPAVDVISRKTMQGFVQDSLRSPLAKERLTVLDLRDVAGERLLCALSRSRPSLLEASGGENDDRCTCSAVLSPSPSQRAPASSSDLHASLAHESCLADSGEISRTKLPDMCMSNLRPTGRHRAQNRSGPTARANDQR
jgi:hypothetical protein